jgi:hypothetical protein
VADHGAYVCAAGQSRRGHPQGQLPGIILEIDSATRFSWLLLGREPLSRVELLMVFSAVLAYGPSHPAAELS